MRTGGRQTKVIYVSQIHVNQIRYILSKIPDMRARREGGERDLSMDKLYM